MLRSIARDLVTGIIVVGGAVAFGTVLWLLAEAIGQRAFAMLLIGYTGLAIIWAIGAVTNLFRRTP